MLMTVGGGGSDTTCANGPIWVANVTLGDFIVTQQAISELFFDGVW